LKRIHKLFGILLIAILARSLSAADGAIPFPFKVGDRVAWIGSSSTRIGIWPKTMEFLLRTRHPELKLQFWRHTTGGGTFATGLENLTKWLDESKPTLVLYNYGGNDSSGGEKGLPKFKENMDKCIAQAKAAGARVFLMTHQSNDVRRAGKEPWTKRKMYAEVMLEYAREKGYAMVDTHHPLESLQLKGQEDNPDYTINVDTIHLTESAYIGWAYYLYERLTPPAAESSAEISASGQVLSATRCKILDAKSENGVLTFTRSDEILPLLPPNPNPKPAAPKKGEENKPVPPIPEFNKQLPPRKLVPLENFSRYMLKVSGLADGTYTISVEGKPVGAADAKSLAAGVNLNSLLLDSKNPAPWEELQKDLYDGKSLEQIGRTAWKFEVKKN